PDSVLRFLGNSIDPHVLLHRRLGRTSQKVCFSEIPHLHLRGKCDHALRLRGALRLDRWPRPSLFRLQHDPHESRKYCYAISSGRFARHLRWIRSQAPNLSPAYVASGSACRSSSTCQRSARGITVEDGRVRTHQIQPIAVPRSGQASLASLHRYRTHYNGLRSVRRVRRTGHETYDCIDERESHGIRVVGDLHSRINWNFSSRLPNVRPWTGRRNALPHVRIHP